jgi:hypothetical protein
LKSASALLPAPLPAPLPAFALLSFMYFAALGLFNPYASLWFKELGFTTWAIGGIGNSPLFIRCRISRPLSAIASAGSGAKIGWVIVGGARRKLCMQLS